MDRLNELPLWWLYLALVAAGAIVGGLSSAIDLLFRGRRQ